MQDAELKKIYPTFHHAEIDRIGIEQHAGNVYKNNKGDIIKNIGKKNIPIPEGDAEIMELNRRAAIASLESEIFNAKIKEEKSKQEEIKTLEIKRDLAPMYLVKHFFSFAENMIQRSYRRFQEISPELEALYLGGKREDAVKFLLREQESITRDAVDKLKKSIKEEGYDLENIEK